jgi:hypothetical protein
LTQPPIFCGRLDEAHVDVSDQRPSMVRRLSVLTTPGGTLIGSS